MYSGKQLDHYAEVGHPYIRDYSITSSLSWVLTMSPLMEKVLSTADFVEVDVTYKASIEMDYLFNVVTFDYTTLHCKFYYL